MTEQHSTILRDSVLTLAGIRFLLFATRQAAAMNNPQTVWFGILISPAPEEEKVTGKSSE